MYFFHIWQSPTLTTPYVQTSPYSGGSPQAADLADMEQRIARAVSVCVADSVADTVLTKLKTAGVLQEEEDESKEEVRSHLFHFPTASFISKE